MKISGAAGTEERKKTNNNDEIVYSKDTCLEKMKFNPKVTSDRSKNRKARFTADSSKRAKIMCAPLSKELSKKWGGVKSMPIRKDDRVRVVRGSKAEEKLEGKVIRVYRKRYCIHIDRLTKSKPNDQTAQLPIDPSNVEIIQLKLDNNRKAKLAAKLKGKNESRTKKGLQPASATGGDE